MYRGPGLKQHCTGAPASNGPILFLSNDSFAAMLPFTASWPPACGACPVSLYTSRKATARICSRGDKELLRPPFHNPSREPGSVIAPHNSAPARTTVTHFVHLPRECAALPCPPRREGRCPSAQPRFHRAHTTRESSGTREACGGGGGSVFKEAAYQSAGEVSHLRRPLIRTARRGFHI